MIGRTLVVEDIRLSGMLLRRALAEIGIESVEARTCRSSPAPTVSKDLRSRAGELRRIVEEGEP